MHGVDIELQNGIRSDINIPIESQSGTFYLMTMVMFALTITVNDIFTTEICMTLIVTFKIRQGQM